MKRLIGVLILTLLNLSTYGQQITEVKKEIKIHFEHDKSVINPDLEQNAESIRELSEHINNLKTDTLLTIRFIDVDSYTSPEGGRHYNQKLSARRTDATCEYLKTEYQIPDSLIQSQHSGIAWDKLRDYVVEYPVPYKDEVLDIIDNTPEETWKRINPTDRWMSLTDSRIKRLMDLRAGKPYNYMNEVIFPFLRHSSLVSIYLVEEKIEEPELVVEEEEEKVEVVEEIVEVEVEQEVEVEPIVEPEKKTVFAIKTNLAAYVPLILNLGIEVPIGNNFSFDLPVYYSPYTVARNYNFRVLIAQPEFRYWFKEAFDGHFIGAHATGGWYNTAFKWHNSDTRYQDKDGETPYYGFGLSYGYAIKLSERWGMEFTAGFGYSRFDYDQFYNIENGAKFNTRELDYWGPTKFGVTISYKFNK